jgi:hypothetical protein
MERRYINAKWYATITERGLDHRQLGARLDHCGQRHGARHAHSVRLHRPRARIAALPRAPVG